MTQNRETLTRLRDFLEDARNTVDRARPHGRGGGASLVRLLEEAGAAAQHSRTLPQPIGILQHVSCSGGSLISRAVALAVNVQLLSEIDPFSDIGLNPMVQMFSPSDIIKLSRNNIRPASDATVADMFVAALGVLYRDFELSGRHLVLRDHCHSRFFTGPIRPHPSVAEMASRVAPIRIVLTVRHPLESYLSLEKNDWKTFNPPTLSQYSKRYQAFLDQAGEAPIFKYEEFVADPGTCLPELLTALGLNARFSEFDLLNVIKVTGDSGRSGDVIAPRAAKSVPEDLQEIVENDSEYRRLCERLQFPYSPSG